MHDTRTHGHLPADRLCAPPFKTVTIRLLRSMTRCAILCLAVAALAVPSPAAGPKRGGTLVAAGGAGLRHLNPAVQSGAQTGLGAQLFAGLVRVDDKFEPHPYLAERWEISEDKRSYTFHLTRNARFHDGKPITSDDVAFSLAVVKENHPFGTAMFDAVDRVDTPDPYTVFWPTLPSRAQSWFIAIRPICMPPASRHGATGTTTVRPTMSRFSSCSGALPVR